MNNVKKCALAISICCVLSGGVLAAEQYIDPAQKKIDVQHKMLVEKYKNDCSIKNRITCLLQAKERASDEVPNRGSIKYSKDKYSSLSAAQAKITLKDLINIYDRVKGQSASSWPGKVTKEQIEAEVRWILTNKFDQSSPDINSAKMMLGMSLR
ncbi:hypothetical protein [Lonsdalea quercina]|uniref:hypothetical protein n=1 Tax=Lonsdalea quercina TaxID=71657 RepID=UPI003976BE7D